MARNVEFQPYFPQLAPPDLPLPVTEPKEIGIENYANSIARLTKQTLPIDLIKIIHRTRIAKTTYSTERLALGSPYGTISLIRGLPEDSPTYFEMTINSKLSGPERRLTIAHEFAHYALFEDGKFNLEKNNEKLVDQVARAILAPTELLMPYLKDFAQKPLETIAFLFGKTHLPPYQLITRLVKDLGLLKGIFIVARNNTPGQIDREWLITNDKNLDEISERESFIRYNFLLSNHFDREGLEKVRPVDESDQLKWALTKNNKKNGWIDIWESDVKGININTRMLDDDGNVEKEDSAKSVNERFTVLNVTKKNKVGEIKDINYLSKDVLFKSIRFI